MSSTPRSPRQLPPGRHGLAAQDVASNQRERILAALAASVSSAGYVKATVEDIISRAGVSRKTFYQHFSNKEEAFLAAYDEAAERVASEIEQAYARSSDFVSSSRNALRSALNALAARPDAAMLGVVEVLAAGPKALERRNAILYRLTRLITEHTTDLPQTPMGSHLTAETVVGGILEVIYNRVQRGETSQLPQYLPDLLYCVLAPFVGREEASTQRARASSELRSES